MLLGLDGLWQISQALPLLRRGALSARVVDGVVAGEQDL